MSFSANAPFNGVVYVTDTIGGEDFQGSGVLIAPNLVLTAAHVVYEAGVGSATNIMVSPGYDQGVAPFGSAYALTDNYNTVADYGDEETLSTSQDDFALRRWPRLHRGRRDGLQRSAHDERRERDRRLGRAG